MRLATARRFLKDHSALEDAAKFGRPVQADSLQCTQTATMRRSTPYCCGETWIPAKQSAGVSFSGFAPGLFSQHRNDSGFVETLLISVVVRGKGLHPEDPARRFGLETQIQ